MKKDKPIMTIVEGQAIVKEAQRLLTASSRRRFLRN
ncbi:oxidoreductase, partial [Klebsiella pneumoniae]|nr:oxidoreductase [Klebsiella pneumoniae]